MKFHKILALLLFAVVFLESCINMSSARPTLTTVTTEKRSSFSMSPGKTAFVYRYLLMYGYINGWDVDLDEMSPAVKNFQLYTGLRATGKVDLDTFILMKKGRCGNRDPYLERNFIHAKRQYTLSWFKWIFKDGSKRALTWKLVNAARGLSFQRTLAILRSAFKKWEQGTNIYFHEVAEYDADIIVKFTPGQHDDPYIFDGEGGAVAHSFYPYPGIGIGGDIHIDNDENFKQEIDLMWVAMHQIGHSLGLRHSGLKSAIMWPWNTRKMGADINLTSDDIKGIQRLYGLSPVDGKKKSTASPTMLVKSPVPPNTIETATTGTVPSDTAEPSTTGTPPPDTAEPSTTGTPLPDTTEPATTGTPPPDTAEPSTTGTPPPDTAEPSTTATVPPGLNESSATGTPLPDTTEPATTGTVPPDTTEPSTTGTVPPDTTEPATTGTVPPDLNESATTGKPLPDTTEPATTGIVPPDTTEPSTTGTPLPDTNEPATTGTVPPDTTEPSTTGTVPPDPNESATTGTVQVATISAKSD